MELIIISGVVLLVLLPFLFFLWNQLTEYNDVNVVVAMEILKEHIQLLKSLGPGSANQVFIGLPPSANVTVTNQNVITVDYNGKKYADVMPAKNIAGILHAGFQNVDLYFDGRTIYFSSCGDGIVEKPREQCDKLEVGACGGPLQCTSDCRCACNNNDDCSNTTYLCDMQHHTCIWCTKKSDCPSDDFACNSGVCVKSDSKGSSTET